LELGGNVEKLIERRREGRRGERRGGEVECGERRLNVGSNFFSNYLVVFS
jgi:hypothetical protein